MSSLSWTGETIEEQVKKAIETAIPESHAEVFSNGNHFEISVVSSAFEGKKLLDKQRLVYSAITPFMSGPDAPIHAVDRLKTATPS